jgi:hypothetical protein
VSFGDDADLLADVVAARAALHKQG